MADVRREQELADKSKNEQTEQIEPTNSNNAIKKLLSKLRKRSIDSRADPDAYHSIDNVTNNQSNSNNLNTNPQSISAISLVSAPAINIATVGFTSKSENSSNRSTSGSTLALPSSVSGTRLITITEKNEVSGRKAGNLNGRTVSPFMSQIKYPVLPPLNEATSVKQKWNILLSKAKGGVENIPRAFLTCTNENSQSISSQLDNKLIDSNENNQNSNRNDQANFFEQEQSAKDLAHNLFPVPQFQIDKPYPTIYKSTSNDAEKLSLRSKTLESCAITTGAHLDESGGFFWKLTIWTLSVRLNRVETMTA